MSATSTTKKTWNHPAKAPQRVSPWDAKRDFNDMMARFHTASYEHHMTAGDRAVLLAVVELTVGHNKVVDTVALAVIGRLAGVSKNKTGEKIRRFDKLGILTWNARPGQRADLSVYGRLSIITRSELAAYDGQPHPPRDEVTPQPHPPESEVTASTSSRTECQPHPVASDNQGVSFRHTQTNSNVEGKSSSLPDGVMNVEEELSGRSDYRPPSNTFASIFQGEDASPEALAIIAQQERSRLELAARHAGPGKEW